MSCSPTSTSRWRSSVRSRAAADRAHHVKDVDATAACATAAGAKVTRPVQDQFYGDRTGSIEDPFGHLWHVATHKEDLSKAEMKRRAAQAAKAGG